MTACTNHVDRSSTARCTGCMEPFCSDCLVKVEGESYCSDCKVMAVEGRAAPTPLENRRRPCKEAGEALKYAIFGIFCFGIILGPVAISKAASARSRMKADPTLTGEGQATAATILGIAVIVLWVFGMWTRLSESGGY